jgi:ferric enterobactin receptor
MRKWIFFGIMAFLQLTAPAQTSKSQKTVKISGSIVDSATRLPLEYATITVFEQNNKKPLNGTTSNKQGQFMLNDLKPGDYDLLIESIGYSPKRYNHVNLTKNSPGALNNVLLSKKLSTLETVTITAPGNLVENKIDKIVFNAEKDLTSQGGVATDLLKKVPQVSVDVDGNVELAGSTSIRFLINGKPSSAFGNNITDVLQSIPASQIKSIEVITNPGAKYDAEGLGGIINIILKNNSASGVNGSISMTVGTRVENGSFNFNARKGNFGLNAFLSGNTRLMVTSPIQSTRLSKDTGTKNDVQLQQDGETKFRRNGFQTGIGFDWTYQKKNSFTGSLNYSSFSNTGDGQLQQSQIISNLGNSISEVQTLNPSDNAFHFHTIDASLNYKRSFAQEDQELEIIANASFGNNHAYANSYQYWQPQDSLFFGTQSNNPGKETETEVQVDYTQPINKKIHLGFGGKFSSRDINSNSGVLSYQPSTQDFTLDNQLTNNLHYVQHVFAAYTEASFPVGNLFDAKLGGRYERTEINSYFSNAQQQANNPGYNTFVPSVFFIKKLGGQQTIKLNYSKRIERPDYRDLNPFVNTIDPKNITAGNPYLRPEIGHRVEISYSKDFNSFGNLMITAFYRTSNDDIQPYIVYYPVYQIGDSTYNNISVSTRQNIGLEKNVGLSIFADLHPTSKFGVRTDLFLFERHTINAIDSGLNSTSFNYRININLSYLFKNNFSAEFFGNFRSPRNELQGKYPSFTTYSFAFRKQIWNKKGSIALTATNPFNEYVNQRTMLYGPNFTVNSLRKIPFRSVGINFTWKFGKLQFKKEKDENRDNSNAAPEG